MKTAQHCGLLRWRMGHETHNVTLKKLGKKGQFVCDLVKKSGGGGGGGGHVSSFERGGPLVWGVHWHGVVVVLNWACRSSTIAAQQGSKKGRGKRHGGSRETWDDVLVTGSNSLGEVTV